MAIRFIHDLAVCLISLVMAVSCNTFLTGYDVSCISLCLDGAAATKVTGYTEDSESEISEVTYFVFNSEGELETSAGTSPSSTEADVKVKNGSKTIYALVNSTLPTPPASEEKLLQTVSYLKDNKSDGLVMLGSVQVNIDKDQAVSIKVRRLVSKIVLKEIAVDLDPEDTDEIQIKRIYLANVNSSITLDGTVNAVPSLWLNQMGVLGEIAEDLLSDSVGRTVENGRSYYESHTFYSYPNNTGSDIHGGDTFTERFTRLVIDTDNGFYRVDLPGLNGNSSYIINKVTIHGKGSEKPDDPEKESCDIDICVTEWNEGYYNSEII